LKTCGHNIRTAHKLITKHAIATVSKDLDKWIVAQEAAIKEASIAFLTSNNNGVIKLDGSDPCLANWTMVQANNLHKHACSILLTQTEHRYVIPWGKEHMDELKAQLISDNHNLDQAACKWAEAQPGDW